MKNVYFNSNDSLVTVTSPNQTGETLPRDYRKGTINSLCRNLTLLFAVLVMSMANIGMAWGESVTATYSHSGTSFNPVTFTTNDYFSAMTIATTGTVGGGTKTGARCNLNGNTNTTITFTYTAKSSFEVTSFKLNSFVNSNDVKNSVITYYKNSETPTELSPAITFDKSDSSPSDKSSSTISESLNNGDVFTIKVSINNSTSTARQWYINTITLYLTASPTCTPCTFKSGDKVYFKDQSSKLTDIDNFWKVNGGNVYAYFWNATENAWSDYGDLVDGDWNSANAIYEITVPGTGKEYTHVLFTRGSSNTCFDCSSTWDKTTDQTPCEGKNLFYLSQDKYAAHIYEGSWGNFTPASKTVYFDNRNVTDWTTAYVRIGHGTSNSAWGPMTKVAGTRNLYSQTTSKWISHTDFSIANKAGWTGQHIDQPEKTYSNGSWSGSEYKMTKQTNYQQYAIENDVYLCPKATSVLEHECQFYQVTNENSTTSSRIDENTTALSLPSYTVTSSASHCTVTMVKYTADNGSTYAALSSGGTVLPTQYVKVTVTPDANYQFGSVEVTGAGTVTAAAAGTPGVYYITGDATITATCTCVALTVNRGGTEATPAEGEPLGTAYGTLTCSATTGVIASYQWKQNTSATTEGAVNAEGTGATTASFSPNPESAGTYYYYCVATDACGNSANTSFSGAFKFNAATYDIIYAANIADATGSTASTTGKSEGYTEPAKACGYSKSGYKFKWWNTAVDGTGEDFYVGETVTLGSSNLTLYAQWESVASNEAYWIPISQASKITGSAINITEGDMNLNSGTATDAADLNIDLTADATKVNKTGSTPKHAKVLAIKNNDKYIEVKFTDGSPINKLYLGATTNNTADKKAVVIYSTTADFSTGEYYCKEITLKGYENATKGIYDVSPATTNKYLYARIYRKVSTAVYSQTFTADAYGATTRIYSIKAQKGTVASTYTGLSVKKDPSAGSASTPTISATSVAVGSGVTVTAGAASSGYVFTGWTSANGTFADANSLSTTFTPNANNAVATANYAVLKTITIKFQHNGNTTGWTIQGKTTYPADQTATITVDGDWVVMTFSNVYAVSNIDLAYSGGDWDYLNTSTKITDDACYNWTGTAISCAELTALVSGTRYDVADMVPEGTTISGSEQTPTGLSANTKFYLVGPTAMAVKSDSKEGVNGVNFSNSYYFKEAASITSNTPTSRAIKFIVPATGTLTAWVRNGKDIKLGKEGAAGTVLISSQTNEYYSYTLDVTAGTYYLYATAGSTTLYAVKFDIVSTYTLTVSGASVDNPMTADSKTGAISGVTITGSPVSSIPSGTTTSTSDNTFTVNKGTPEIVTATATISGSSAECDECTYVFDHWTNVPATVTADVSTIEAVYKTTYTISFKETDGTAVAGISSSSYVYGVGKLASTLPTPSKSGYTFDGWYNENTLTTPASDIDDDAWGNVTYYAKWTEDTGNKVTYNGNDNTGGSVPTDDTDYAAGEIVTVKGNTGSLVKTGQTFLGWSTSATASSGTFYPAGYKFEMPASNVTLYAVWGSAAEEKYYYGSISITASALTPGSTGGHKGFFTSNSGVIASSNVISLSDTPSETKYYYESSTLTHTELNKSSNWNTTSTSKRTIRAFKFANGTTYTLALGSKVATSIMFYGKCGSKSKTMTVGDQEYESPSTADQFFSHEFTKSGNFTGNVSITQDGDFYGILVITISTGAASNFTVSFNMNGHGSAIDAIANVPSGSKIGEPIPAPTAAGNTFGGWYKENTCTNAWNFASDVVNSDKTLYAKWTNCAPTITTQPVGNTYTRGGAPVAMTVETSGDVTGYQWFSNDENNATTGTPIDGQTTGGYTPTTGVVGTTYYYCVVSNDCGSVASNVVAIVVNDDRPTPCAAWTIDEPTHGGQGFSFSVAAKKSDCSEAWDGTLTEGMLTVSEGVILGAITVDNDDDAKTISGTYGVSGTAESPVTFYLSLPRTDTHSAALLSQTRTFTACAGGAEEFYWSANVSSPLTANTAAKLISKTTSSEIALSGTTTVNTSTRSTDDATGIVDGTTYSFKSTDPHHSYIKMASGDEFHFTTTAAATISVQFTIRSNDEAGIEIHQSSKTGTLIASKLVSSKQDKFQTLTTGSVPAGTYYVVAKVKEINIGEILVVQGSGSAGSITPTLAWSNDQEDGATLEKREDAVDFAITANRSDANALASLGTISYSSSNASVATVNAATGQVTIADNIDFGSETYKTTTITATLAASGCYKRAQISYVLKVNKYVCTETVGTVSIQTDNGCEGKVLAVSGYEADATIQWYKDGVSLGASATSATYTANEGGTYYVVTTKTCDAVSNEITITFGTATATKIVDEWYVKNGRRTPDIALVQTTNATGFTVTVKSSSTVIWNSNGTVTTGFGGCGFYLGTDGIIYLKGQRDDGTEPSGLTEGDETITITASACGAASGLDIVIHKQEQRGDKKPEIAFVVDGGVGKAVTNVSPDKTSNRALWTYLTSAFDLTGCNIYWTTDEKALRQYYSQYDAILITDDPNTRQYPDGKDEKISATKGYVNAMGALIDVRPLLTMEAYVSRLANWDCVKGTPQSPNPREYVLKLQCKEHTIYKTIAENGTTVRHEMVDGIDNWYITMVDASNKTYADTDDETDATGTPALQGFDGKVNAGMLGIGTIANETLQGGIERQAEPAARMMVLGINNKAMAALTEPGKKVIMNALTYLLHTDMETLEDCSNYFDGNEGTSTDWFTAANWSAGKVPDPTVRAIILAPCVISGQTARASSVDIAVGGTTGRYKSGTTECEGNISISANGALVLNEGVSRIEDAPNFGVLNRKPTRTSDLAILSESTGNGTLILNNEEGNTQATVAYYSKASTDEADIWNWQYMAVPFNDNSSAYRNYYDSYLYRWAENCSGWEVVPNRGAVYPWVGYTITQVGTKTYYMDGTLVETGEQTFTVPAGADLVLGNSWTAPLQVKQFEDDDFDGLQKKVYLFNTGYDYEKNGTQYEDGAAHYEAGTYVVVPIHSSPYTGDSLISSLQAFTVTSDGGEGTLTLDYERHVRPARSTDKVNAGAMHAPSRMMAQDDKPEVLKIWASGQRFDDRLVVLEREDFSTGYDEGWDGEKVLMGEAAPTVYTVMENGYESVTATNDYEGTLIGFKAGEDSEYTFRFDYDDNAEAIYLLDTDVRMYVRILTGTTYTFTCPDKGEHNRFLLTRKAPGISTGCEPIDGSGGIKATKFIKDNKLYILLNGVLYDATGKIVVR